MKATKIMMTLAVALIAVGCTTEPGATGDKNLNTDVVTIRVTGIPDENPSELQRRNAPLVEYLSSELGTKVEYIPVTDYGAAVAALAAGQVDFAWLGGFTHVQARKMSGAVPLTMRAIDREFQSVFITHVSSGVEQMKDIKGKTIAFGSKSSTSGHLMPRHFLAADFGIDSDKDLAGEPVFSGAHDATAKVVESGKVAVGALNKQVWERLLAEGKIDPSKVKLLWTTPGYVDYVWTARQELSPTVQKKFTEAFLKLDPKVPAHAEVLSLQNAKRFVNASPSDFNAIEGVAVASGLLK